jgi:hypothetical protein
MNRITNFFGLTKNLNFSLKNEKADFINRFKQDIKPDRLIFLDFFDNNPNKYYGAISDSKFKIRPGYEYSFAQARGIIKNDSSEIGIQILGYNWFSILYLIVIVGLGFGALFDLINNKNYGAFPIILFSTILTLFFYYKLKKGIKSFKNTLESDLKKYDK